MGELDSVGDVVTGGLLAGVVEPGAGDPDHTHEGSCLNCGTKLVGPYCAACGQQAHIPRSLTVFFQDMVQGLFNFEGKIGRTLPMLAWKPGELTRRYIAGERATFISPVALYLFSVFLMFAVLNFTGAIDPDTKAVTTSVATAMQEEKADLARLEAKRAKALAAGQKVAAIDRRIASQKEDMAQLQRVTSGEFIQTKLDDNDETPPWLRDAVKRGQENPELMVTNV